MPSQAFERYRRSPNAKTTLPRLILGSVIVGALWFGVTTAVVFGGAYAWLLTGHDDPLASASSAQQFLGTSAGLFATLASFAGIWLGLWIAMRWLHGEKLSRLFGNSGRISRSGFLNGCAAVLLTSVLTEIAYLLVIPGVVRSALPLAIWALFLVPVVFLAFVQTSSEELLFRGYLQRGLAYRFRSPLIWAVLPTLAFTAMHWNPAAVLTMNVGVLISIGAFAALLALLVYATGNLGAAMGAHFGNNIVGFVLISHDDALGSLALLRAPPLDSLAWTPGETAAIAGISVVSILLTWLLLLHPRSPLSVRPGPGLARGDGPPPAEERLRQTPET